MQAWAYGLIAQGVHDGAAFLGPDQTSLHEPLDVAELVNIHIVHSS